MPDAVKDAVKAVLDQVDASRTNLELDSSQSKGESLARDLSDSWSSPKAEDYETEIFDLVVQAGSQLDNIRTTLEEALGSGSDEDGDEGAGGGGSDEGRGDEEPGEDGPDGGEDEGGPDGGEEDW